MDVKEEPILHIPESVRQDVLGYREAVAVKSEDFIADNEILEVAEASRLRAVSRPISVEFNRKMSRIN